MSKWHYRECPKCHRLVLARAEDGYNGVCTKCARPHNSFKKSARFVLNDPDSLIIDYDPLPISEGGFRKGVYIPRSQVECMCQYQTFSDGTILVDKNNNKYQVCRTYDGRQELVLVT